MNVCLSQQWTRSEPSWQPYLHDSIQGCVCPDAQSRARNIVTYGGGQHTHRDAKLLIGGANLIQLQQTFERLKRQSIEKGLEPSGKATAAH